MNINFILNESAVYVGPGNLTFGKVFKDAVEKTNVLTITITNSRKSILENEKVSVIIDVVKDALGETKIVPYLEVSTKTSLVYLDGLKYHKINLKLFMDILKDLNNQEKLEYWLEDLYGEINEDNLNFDYFHKTERDKKAVLETLNSLIEHLENTDLGEIIIKDEINKFILYKENMFQILETNLWAHIGYHVVTHSVQELDLEKYELRTYTINEIVRDTQVFHSFNPKFVSSTNKNTILRKIVLTNDEKFIKSKTIDQADTENLNRIDKLAKNLKINISDRKADNMVKEVIDIVKEGLKTDNETLAEKSIQTVLKRKPKNRLRRILKEDILERYDNPEYWDPNVLEEAIEDISVVNLRPVEKEFLEQHYPELYKRYFSEEQ